MKSVFRHYKNVGKTRLRRFIDDACATGQIEMYDRPCTPFKDILESEHVTVCYLQIINGTELIGDVCGYAFCRGDVFNKERGRWVAENRARVLVGIPVLQDPYEDRQEAARAVAEIRHAENRRLGLKRQEEVRMAQEVNAEASD